jgi:hypothetical protein
MATNTQRIVLLESAVNALKAADVALRADVTKLQTDVAALKTGSATVAQLDALAARVAVLEGAVPVPPPPVPPPAPTLVIAPPVGPFTTLDGGGTVESGVFLRNNGGGAVRKMYVKRFTGYGVANMDWNPPREPVGRTAITDCITEDIGATPPHSLVPPGTAEAGFWFGNPTDAARLIARRAAWMGMWTGAKFYDAVVEDFVLDEMPLVGLYVEHVSRNSIFRRFRIKSLGSGVNIEWWYGGQGSHHITFEDGDVYCPPKTHWTISGMFFDAGTYGCTVRRVRFWGPGDAIGLPLRLAGPDPNVVDEASCKFENTGKKVWYHDDAIGSASPTTAPAPRALTPGGRAVTIRENGLVSTLAAQAAG